MYRSKTAVWIGAAVLIVFFAAISVFIDFRSGRSSSVKNIVRVGQAEFDVEVALTDKERAQGLSGRAYLPQSSGMLFIFDLADKHSFWMKDMKFPLDIIWIRSENFRARVVGFHENVMPEPSRKSSELTLYYPQEPVNWVLEVNAGAISKHSIKVGDSVEWLVLPAVK